MNGKGFPTIAVLVGLAVVGLAAWFFLRKAGTSTTSSKEPSSKLPAPTWIEGGSKPVPVQAPASAPLPPLETQLALIDAVNKATSFGLGGLPS